MATAIDISGGGTMSQVDALWTLIQGQKKARIRTSIEKGWSEVKNSMRSGKELKSAEELLRELRVGQ